MTTCARRIVATHQPLNACESDEFKEMSGSITQLKLPDMDNKTVKKILTTKYYGVIEAMKARIVDKPFCMIMDHWKSKSKDTYRALIVHFIENFEFESHTLCCKRFPGSTFAQMECEVW
jgi:ribosome-associated toxin RatA of RatAB toxin-antitoxin module